MVYRIYHQIRYVKYNITFCKELLEPKKEATFKPGPEHEKERRRWWENGVSVDIEDLQKSVRWIKFWIAILFLVIVLSSRKIF